MPIWRGWVRSYAFRSPTRCLALAGRSRTYRCGWTRRDAVRVGGRVRDPGDGVAQPADPRGRSGRSGRSRSRAVRGCRLTKAGSRTMQSGGSALARGINLGRSAIRIRFVSPAPAEFHPLPLGHVRDHDRTSPRSRSSSVSGSMSESTTAASDAFRPRADACEVGRSAERGATSVDIVVALLLQIGRVWARRPWFDWQPTR